MYDEKTDTSALARNSNLNEELGQVRRREREEGAGGRERGHKGGWERGRENGRERKRSRNRGGEQGEGEGYRG